MRTAEKNNSPHRHINRSPKPFFNKTGKDAFFAENALQTKLSIGNSNDKYEQEADAIARKVVSRKPIIQAKPEDGVEEKLQAKEEGSLHEEISQIQQMGGGSPEEGDNNPDVQLSTGGGDDSTASEGLESSLNASKGGGTPLGDETKSEMESAFGTDFSGVRVHTDSQAIQMNQDLQAQAFTHGQDVYFNEGKYNPASNAGKELLAHELTHVVQQGGAVNLKIQKQDMCEEPQPDYEDSACYPENDFTYDEDQVCEAPQNENEDVSQDQPQECKPPDYEYIGSNTWLEANVKAPRGIRLHLTPSTMDKTYVNRTGIAKKIYKPWTKVMIAAIGNSKAKGWVKLSTPDGNWGWIERRFITTEYKKRDPNVLKYVAVPRGEKLVKIVQREYYKIIDIRYGQDERAVVEAFVILNSNNTERPIQFLGKYSSSFIKDKLLDASMKRAREIFNTAQLIQGRLLKYPSQDYMVKLVEQGKISSRPAWKNKVFKFGRSVQGFIRGVGEGFVDAAVGTVKGLWGLVKSIFTGEIIDQAKALYNQVSSLGWQGILNLLKEMFFSEMAKLRRFIKGRNPQKKWWAIGKIVGMIIFEVVLAIFTAGVGTAVRVASKVGRVAKAMNRVNKIGQKIPGIKRLTNKSRGKLNRVDNAKKRELVEAVDAKDVRVKAAQEKLGGKSPKRPIPPPPRSSKPKSESRSHSRSGSKRGAWRIFKIKVKNELKTYGDRGVSKRNLRIKFKRIVARHKVAKLPLVSSRSVLEEKGFYTVHARRKMKRGGYFPRATQVGKVPMETMKRWRKARKALKKRLRRLRDSDYSTGRLNQIIKPYIKWYHFKSLKASWDSKEKDWNIHAKMNPNDPEYVEVEDVRGLHKGTYLDPIPIHFYKRTQGAADYPSSLSVVIKGVRESIPMFGNRTIYYKGNRYRYGVSKILNNMKRGKKLKLVPKRSRPTPAQRSKATRDFKKVLLAKGTPARFFTGKHIDHVKDVAFGGSNLHSNLWPLNGDINSGRLWRNAIKTPYRLRYKELENGSWKAKEDDMFSNTFIRKKTWFKIVGFKWPPPSPGGKD